MLRLTARRGRLRLIRARHVAGFATVLIAAALLGCGGASHHHLAVVRIGQTTIDKRLVDHWAHAIAGVANVAVPASAAHESRTLQALAYLISVQWLLHEAADHGLRLSQSQLQHRVQAQREATVGSPSELDASLAASGETPADVRLQVEAAWAEAAVHELLLKQAASVARHNAGAAAAASYYKQHMARYRVPEARYFDIIEGLRTPAAARALAARIGAGRRFASMAFHESHERPARFNEPNGKGPLFRSLFAARIGTLGGPFHLNHGYVLYVVRRVVRAAVRPFAAVKGAIEQSLLARARRRALAEAVRAYAIRWKSRTDCRVGDVVQKCRQYRGPVTMGDYQALLEGENR